MSTDRNPFEGMRKPDRIVRDGGTHFLYWDELNGTLCLVVNVWLGATHPWI